MADFLTAHELTAINEGGYTNNSSDNGNYYSGRLIGTNYGISAPVLAKFLGRVPTVADMKTLSKTTAQTIYRRNYWNVIRGDDIIDQTTANQIYDMAVNSGPGRAVKLWQRALGITETGIMDEFTINKTNLK